MMRSLTFSYWLVLAAAPVVAQDPHATVTVGTAAARRGQIAYGVLHVPAGVDSATNLPVAVVNGARAGPVLALVAGSHGTEYTSIVALTRLIAQLDPRAIRRAGAPWAATPCPWARRCWWLRRGAVASWPRRTYSP